MNKITQTMRYRQSLIQYAQKHGVTKAAIHYRTNRQYIYRWRKRYDGTLSSLEDHSHRPHSHPNAHTAEEIKLIANMRRRNPNAGLVVFWVKLRMRGYTRSVSGLYRFLRKRGQIAVPLPNPKYTPKPYEQMQYPGQRGQIDVKFVPASCLVGDVAGQKFYQYTFIDEYSRFRYLEAFEEHNMTLTSLGAGVVSVGGLVISAVRDFLFGTSSATAVLTHGVSLSGKFAVAYNAYPEKVAAFNTANDVGYVITQKIPRGNGNYMWEVIILSTGFTTTDNVNFSFSGSYTVPPYLDFTYRDEFGNTSYGNWTRLVFSAYSGYEPVVYTSLPVTTSTSLDLNIGNIGTLNPDDNIDVIYPGWYQNAESVDTNIGVDTDGDSVVDTNIPVDSYYPLGVPLNPSDIYNQTQAGAQTGTSTGALEGTKDDIYDSTKDGADGYNIGGAGEYTFQVKDFFPFCIPFDLYDMLTCLAAEPEAPSFTWTIPVLGNNYDINVDLSAFDSVAVLVRSLEMLAFAVGLAFASKRLIQGGD